MREDDALWAQVAARNADAFEKLYHNHYAQVRGFLRSYLGDAPAVDDLTQDKFLQLWQRPLGFDPSRSTLKAYLLGIARKKAADWWRHQRPDRRSARRNSSGVPRLRSAAERRVRAACTGIAECTVAARGGGLLL
jgi:RNA polymerase sigma-70 factor (ECF subfamily)